MNDAQKALLRAIHELNGAALDVLKKTRSTSEQLEQATAVINYIAAALRSPSLFDLNMARAATIATPASAVEQS